MSKLAQQVIDATGVTIPDNIAHRSEPGPLPACRAVYGRLDLDLEDWASVQALKETRDWHQTQAELHRILGISETLTREKFRYHWLRGCSCWPKDLRR